MDHPGQFSRGIFHRVERKTDCFKASHCVSLMSGRPPTAQEGILFLQLRCAPSAISLMPHGRAGALL